MNISNRIRKLVVLPFLAGAILSLSNNAVQAAATDLSTGPLITPGASTVRPNLFFILDNSGSMNWDYLPDWVVDSTWCKGSTGTASLYCCRNAAGNNITSSSDTSTCLPQNSIGTNLDGNGYSSLRGMPPFHSSDFNSNYYNPAITYTPPINADGTSKTSYSGTGSVPWDGYNVQYSSSDTITLTSGFPDVEWCTDGTYGTCLRNDNYLLPGAVGGNSYTTMHATTTGSGTTSFATGSPTSPSSASRSVGPYFYTMVPGEYCTTAKQTDCIYANGQTTVGSKVYSYPATLRWCNNTAGRVAGEPGASSSNACQGVKNATYQYPRYPTLAISAATVPTSSTGVVTVGGTLPDSGNTTGTDATCAAIATANKATITSIKLNGTQLLTSSFTYCDGNSNQNTRNANLAEQIRLRIGNGFSVTRSGASLTITTPTGTSYNSASLTYTVTGASSTLTISTSFSGGGAGVSGVYVPGAFRRTNIVSGDTFGNTCVSSSGVVTDVAGVCPGTSTTLVDRSDRTDCALRPSCTYAEELRNFANWFAWYRSRMQMAKSALSVSFQSVDDRYRVGYFTINNSSSNLVNIAPFDIAQKTSWYAKLFAANPSGSTPLRVALANAGRIFAGKTTAITGATDPMQYSCQKNYTILSTDGYWNGSNGVKINGSTSIGNEDSTGMVIPLPPDINGVTGPFADTYSSSLADVAAYYYKTDLRDASLANCTGALGTSVCANDAPTGDNDKNTAQHMTTFTIGLGIDGVMKFRDNYTSSTTDTTDDYSAVRDATTANPTQGICPWQTSGACNWPDPQTASSSEVQERIDDLWHAAVNGHGKYYSARDALALSRGLRDVLSGIGTSAGTSAAAATSNPNVTTGDNFIFTSLYWTKYWVGEFSRESIDLSTGDITLTGNDWKAHELLDSASWSGRSIYTFVSGGGVPRNFNWSSLTGTSGGVCTPPTNEKGCFSSTYIDSGLAQFCTIGPMCLAAADKVTASGQYLVDYLRGDKTYEDTISVTGFYRERKHRLGDIVSSEAYYVGKYVYDYGTSNGYPDRNTSRSDPTIYVAANDGMLHAFNAGDSGAGGGTERWAYVPSMVMKSMHRLADKEYDTNHRYLVDGSPIAGDVKDSGVWKTILVGGLAGGGAGYYALDITSQTAPKVLWEFRQKSGCVASTSPRFSSSARMTEDCDLGFSYGNPIITKLLNGTWVVMVTSGYNNHTNGDGKGYLYILDAMTGAVLHKASTGVGDTTTPSGLSRITAWAENALKDNTAKYVYGGDLLGNLWKFDLTSGSPVKSLLINVGSSKPITAKPALGQVVKTNGQKKRVVFFSTGRLLGNVDLTDMNTQSTYGIWDADSGSPTTLVTSTAASGGDGRVGSVLPSVFEDDTNLGWQLDFPEAGERGNTDPAVAFGTLVFTTNKPTTPDPCNPSGFTSWIYNLDYRSGGVVELPGDTNTHLATAYTGAATRPIVAVLPSGAAYSYTRVTGGAGGVGGGDRNTKKDPLRHRTHGLGAHRVTWRELLN
jgi:type IV pilus assembly protein PilY1